MKSMKKLFWQKMFWKVNLILISGVMMLYNSGVVAESEILLPEFSKISINKLESMVDASIFNYKATVNAIVHNQGQKLEWQQLLQPLEDSGANLDAITNIVSHLHAVKDSPELRGVYSNILPKLSNFNAEFLQNRELQQKILQLKESTEFDKLNVAQQKIIKNLLLDFKLAGVDLLPEQQAKYKAITAKLSELSDQFSKNVLDATQSWTYYIAKKDQHKLNGLPQHFIELAAQTALKHGLQDGWMLTLDLPSVDVVLRHAKDRGLRKIIYTAHATKASDKFDKIQFDNSKIMQSIVMLRAELALLLGFKNYSEYSLAHKMAKTTTEVVNFLDELAKNSLPVATKEFLALQKFAKQQDNIDKLQPWDVGYYSEKYKETLFNLSAEELRSYFQLKYVLPGVFKLAHALYGIVVQEVTDFDSWDPQVKLYKVIDKDQNLRGYFYTDLYVRENKQAGAWMGSCLSRHQWQDGTLQYPVAFLVTNFTKPTTDAALLYHDEVTTLLHEFGHVLHHILTKVNYISVAGVNGVSWDAVELPSQFMEKWSYDWQFLQDVSVHKDTQEKISKQIFDSLIGIKNYQAGMFMVRQLEFGMFDFNLHMWHQDASNKEPNIQKILDQVRAKINVVPVAPFNRFQNSFSHIFAGGYAAGYYSYNWAEVLASDAFMAFQAGSDPSILGDLFLKNILEKGGSIDAMDLYIAFRGTKPNIKSLLKYKNL